MRAFCVVTPIIGFSERRVNEQPMSYFTFFSSECRVELRKDRASCDGERFVVRMSDSGDGEQRVNPYARVARPFSIVGHVACRGDRAQCAWKRVRQGVGDATYERCRCTHKLATA